MTEAHIALIIDFLKERDMALHSCDTSPEGEEEYRQSAIDILALKPQSYLVCGACGQPWTGEVCGQFHNANSFPVCYAVEKSG